MSTKPTIRIADAIAEGFVDEVKALVMEYAESLDFKLCFQRFDKEMNTFPDEYAPPAGCLLVGLVDNEPVGCVGIRKLDDEACEMKRLYVKPEYRGLRVGRALVDMTIEHAAAVGYKKMRLDVIENMIAAVGLYRSLGFKPSDPYRHNPIKGALFMELDLR
jgi:ribosomal protein S18 acetylase RimI-like enzyme